MPTQLELGRERTEQPPQGMSPSTSGQDPKRPSLSTRPFWMSVSRARLRCSPSENVSGSSGLHRVTAMPASSYRVHANFSVIPSSLVPYWLSTPTLTFRWPSWSSRRGPGHDVTRLPSAHALRSRLESFSHRLVASVSPSARSGLPALVFRISFSPQSSHEVSLPYDDVKWGKRPTLGFHTQLCCTFRLSQPLGALFLPHPLGFISRQSRLGFGLQSVPL